VTQNWEDQTTGDTAFIYYRRTEIPLSSWNSYDWEENTQYEFDWRRITWETYPWQVQIQVNDIIKIGNEQLRVIDYNSGPYHSRIVTVERGYNSTPTNTGNFYSSQPWYRYVNAVTQADSEVTVYVWNIYQLRWKALAYQAGASEGTHFITGSV
jgi:hypothetical protein